MNRVLEGIRVLDFGRYIAGPFCATLLGDMGAEVIRVERVGGSEDRTMAQVCDTAGGTFLQTGRNKLSLTLDPMKPAGREIVRRLVSTGDVVVANLPFPTLKEMRIDYESLRAVKPEIILTHVSAFGADGPYSERVGFDLLGQAMSGMMYISGSEAAPVRSQIPFVDFSTATFAAFGTLAALMERQKSGQGQIVEASLFTSSLVLNNNFVLEEEVLRLGRTPHGNPGHHAAPNDVFRTRDGSIIIMAVGETIYKRWAKLMGEEVWLTDPRFATDRDRGNNWQPITERMAAWCAQRTTGEAIRDLEAARIPAGPVYRTGEVLQDPHVKARAIFQTIDYPGAPRRVPLAETPVRLSRTPGGIRTRPPTIGEHTDQVLAELGYGAQEIDALRGERVI